MVKIIVVILALITSSYAVTINCEYSLESWPIVNYKYSCMTTLSEVSTNQRLTGVRGDHQVGKNHSDVESINFSDCTGSTFIPRDMLNFFANLIGIRLINCGILILSGNELNEYQNLQLFAVESTRLERIPGNFFASTPQITVIGFAENNLKHVGSKLLQSLNNLAWISFFDNDCINQTATSSAEIPSLITNLTANCIDIFEETTVTSTTITTSEVTPEMTTEEETTTMGSEDVKENFIMLVMTLILYGINF